MKQSRMQRALLKNSAALSKPSGSNTIKKSQVVGQPMEEPGRQVTAAVNPESQVAVTESLAIKLFVRTLIASTPLYRKVEYTKSLHKFLAVREKLKPYPEGYMQDSFSDYRARFFLWSYSICLHCNSIVPACNHHLLVGHCRGCNNIFASLPRREQMEYISGASWTIGAAMNTLNLEAKLILDRELCLANTILSLQNSSTERK